MLHATTAHRRTRIGRRHGLGIPLPSIAAATTAMTAWHATDHSTIHLALHARVRDITVADVDHALFEERSIIRQMSMRRTIFGVGRDLLPAVVASAGRRVADANIRALGKLPVADGWVDRARGELIALLDQQPLTSREIREALPWLGDTVQMGAGKWATDVTLLSQLLPALAADGSLTRGHNAGHWRLTRPVWSSMRAWLGHELALPTSEEGYSQVVRRWLWTFGPGTEEDLVWWLGSTKAAARRALADNEAVQVSLDDDATGWVLPDDTADLEAPAAAEPWAALTPTLDPTLMGWRQREWFVDPRKARLVFDTAGNGVQSVWAAGQVVGVWLQDDVGHPVVRLFTDVSLDARRRINEEAERLDAFLDGGVVPNVYRVRMEAGQTLP